MNDTTTTVPPSPATNPATQDDREALEHPYRFQRTDQWRPIYTWLESLDADDIIKSKDISDWLAANPEIYQQLTVNHSRYYVMHYIKKCHFKVLKKRKGAAFVQKHSEASMKKVKVDYVDVPIGPALPEAIQATPLSIVPKENDLYRVKREEALQKYEILVELEKQLLAISPKQTAAEK